VQWRLASARRAGTRGRRCSAMVVTEDKEGEAEPVKGSLEHEWQRRGGMTAVARARRESRGERERAQERGQTSAVKARVGGALL
jgi:hypothetical protein